MSLLLSSGLLTRHLTQKDAYWFALAGIGPLVKSLLKGRKVLSLACTGVHADCVKEVGSARL